jgi:hypothetical protein
VLLFPDALADIDLQVVEAGLTISGEAAIGLEEFLDLLIDRGTEEKEIFQGVDDPHLGESEVDDIVTILLLQKLGDPVNHIEVVITGGETLGSGKRSKNLVLLVSGDILEIPLNLV